MVRVPEGMTLHEFLSGDPTPDQKRIAALEAEVERLRLVHPVEIVTPERLRMLQALLAEVERLRGALKTIAALGDPTWDWCESGSGHAVCDQAKAFARAALEPQP